MCVCVCVCVREGEREVRGRRDREGSGMGEREREVWRKGKEGRKGKRLLVSRRTREQLCPTQTNTCRLGGKEHCSEVPPRVVR